MKQASRLADEAQAHVYAIGVGSNRPLSRKLGPRAIVAAAIGALDEGVSRLIVRSPVIDTRPLGPSDRLFANAAALIASALPPLAMLDHLQSIERRFHRRRYRRWGARTLDLDLLLWSGGAVRHKRLIVPHPALRQRAFVLTPLGAIARGWQVPGQSLLVAHLARRLAKPKPVDRKSLAL